MLPKKKGGRQWRLSGSGTVLGFKLLVRARVIRDIRPLWRFSACGIVTRRVPLRVGQVLDLESAFQKPIDAASGPRSGATTSSLLVLVVCPGHGPSPQVSTPSRQTRSTNIYFKLPTDLVL